MNRLLFYQLLCKVHSHHTRLDMDSCISPFRKQILLDSRYFLLDNHLRFAYDIRFYLDRQCSLVDIYRSGRLLSLHILQLDDKYFHCNFQSQHILHRQLDLACIQMDIDKLFYDLLLCIRRCHHTNHACKHRSIYCPNDCNIELVDNQYYRHS